MATAKWWVCDSCRSLNDIPANKCYKCRAQKPSHPTLIDANYVQVGSTQKRVGVTVDRSRVAELTAPQPVEREPGSGVFEAYGATDDQPLEAVRKAEEPKAPPRPLREPPRRSIAQVGGFHWEYGLAEADRREAASRGEGAAPSSAAQGPTMPGPTGQAPMVPGPAGQAPMPPAQDPPPSGPAPVRPSPMPPSPMPPGPPGPPAPGPQSPVAPPARPPGPSAMPPGAPGPSAMPPGAPGPSAMPPGAPAPSAMPPGAPGPAAVPPAPSAMPPGPPPGWPARRPEDRPPG
jgi:hypothetical protein